MQEAVANTLHLDGLLAAVCKIRKLHPMGIRSKSVDECHVEARRVLCKLAYRRGISLSSIGRYLGRDHTTIRYNVHCNGGRLPDDAKRIEALWLGGATLPASDLKLAACADGELEVVARLTVDAARTVTQIAAERGMTADALVSCLLNTAITDNLVSAILDTDG